MDDDTLHRSRTRPMTSIADLLGTATNAAEPEETAKALDNLTPLPGPGDPYKAFARPSVKMLATVHFLMGNAKEGFSYADLRRLRMIDSDEPGKGPVILLYFAAMAPTEVRIEGNRLDTLYDLLGQHRLAWVREWPTGRGFSDPMAALVSRITVKLLEEFSQA